MKASNMFLRRLKAERCSATDTHTDADGPGLDHERGQREEPQEIKTGRKKKGKNHMKL